MADVAAANTVTQEGAGMGCIGKVPVRNLWLLMLYSSDLFRELGKGNVSVEANPEDIPDLVAEVLSHIVQRRLKKNLSFGYRSRDAVLNRIRGRIDLLITERRQLLLRGKIACRYEDLTVNTPRNRFVRAALYAIARMTIRSDLRYRCRGLADTLKMLGVSGEKPTRHEISVDRFARHDSDDKLMVSAAQLAFDLRLPTEDAGNIHMLQPDRDVIWVRKLFERAVGGFYDVVLSPHGWHVFSGNRQNWIIDKKTAGIDDFLPNMKTDIVLDCPAKNYRIIIDTKFNSLIVPGWFRDKTFRNKYIYQIYAYLRSQEGNGDPLSDHASGMLLHPSIDISVDETVLIQGHAIRFATVDLAQSTKIIRDRLITLITFPDGFK